MVRDVVANALVEMGAPGAVHLDDWACPYGRFNTSVRTECVKCVNDGRHVSAKHRFMVARDEPGKVEL